MTIVVEDGELAEELEDAAAVPWCVVARTDRPAGHGTDCAKAARDTIIERCTSEPEARHAAERQALFLDLHHRPTGVERLHPPAQVRILRPDLVPLMPAPADDEILVSREQADQCVRAALGDPGFRGRDVPAAADDNDLREWIKGRLGEYSGGSAPHLPWRLAMGSRMRLWVAWRYPDKSDDRHVLYKGRALVDAVRDLLGVERPGRPARLAEMDAVSRVFG